MSEQQAPKRDWIDIGLRALTPLLAGIVIAYVSFFGDSKLKEITSQQESARLITELQIKREQAESALRKDIFAQALEAFLLKGRATAEGDARTLSLREMSKQLLRLELLALNFGDSLSLSPLFTEMRSDLTNAVAKEGDEVDFLLRRAELLKRLNSLAKRVASAQLSSLLQRGKEKSITIPLENYADVSEEEYPCRVRLYKEEDYPWPQRKVLRQLSISADDFEAGTLSEENQAAYERFFSKQSSFLFEDVQRFIEVRISDVDHCEKELKVQIIIERKVDDFDDPEADRSFTLDYYNFPVVDNTRLRDNHRLAVVIDRFDLGEEPEIEISAVIFPSEYASLRDRPGMEEARELLESALEGGNGNGR